MSTIDTIIAVIFITFSGFLIYLCVATLQLIKELKESLFKLNKMLEKPESITPALFKKFEQSMTSPQQSPNQTHPHFFHRQKTNSAK